MNLSEKDRLLREILAGDQLTELRRTSLALGLETVRGKRRRRRAAWQIVCLMAALAGTLGIGLLRRSAPPQPTLVIAPVTAAPPGIKIISEKELFALFPDRPLALIGKPGRQRLVFLDEEFPSTPTTGAGLTE